MRSTNDVSEDRDISSRPSSITTAGIRVSRKIAIERG